MNPLSFNPSARRIAKSRLAGQLGSTMKRGLQLIGSILAVSGLLFYALGSHYGLSLLGLGVMFGVFYTWINRDLGNLGPAPVGSATELSDLLPQSFLAYYRPDLSGSQLFSLAVGTWDGQFLFRRYGLTLEQCAPALGGWTVVHQDLWTEATRLAPDLSSNHLTGAVLVCAAFHLNQNLEHLLTSMKLTVEDLEEGARWANRLDTYTHAKRPIYGGLARDWAAGFTPLLNQYGENLSQQVEFAGKYFHLQERTTQLEPLITGLSSANASVVLVGEPGVGKSALLLGLADQLLQGVDGPLAHHQIMSLNASVILSGAGQGSGRIEQIVMNLFNEAAHAGNIVVALDEAQLFFGQGTGAVNLSQILLPVLQSHRLKLVLAIAPGDWQKLKATNAAMASLLTPLILSEPDQAGTMRILADRALLMETATATVTYQALLEAYRLSGRYLQEEAYPGKALKVLQSSLNFPENGLITATSVQKAIEGQYGVKVGQASGAESDVLLGLEDKIHERMINQTRAVSVVANALRRARAGVSNPKRPIGSFLFLGPTGVGKTELARSLAAIYFGAETNIIRLDMSEYQQIADVNRILEDANTSPQGLLPRIRQSPFSVVLFDEIEKAHPNILNLFLQLLDEGNLTDVTGHSASFKDAIIIATSNAGADEIRRHIEEGEELENFEDQFVNDLINSGAFKPELLNRFDEIVLFRPLKQSELSQVVNLMMAEVNRTLEPQKIRVELTPDAIEVLVSTGYDPRLGARPMRRMVQRKVEDAVAAQILRGQAAPGAVITLDAGHLAGAENATPPAAAAPAAPSTLAPPTNPAIPTPDVADEQI
jgi:ATP-dependent Clp protease ATP-binding subunit ClpC